MVNVQILVRSNQKLCIIKHAMASMATILHHESHAKFPLNGHPQYLLNDRLAFHPI